MRQYFPKFTELSASPRLSSTPSLENSTAALDEHSASLSPTEAPERLSVPSNTVSLTSSSPRGA
jgi:hypothetical protein